MSNQVQFIDFNVDSGLSSDSANAGSYPVLWDPVEKNGLIGPMNSYHADLEWAAQSEGIDGSFSEQGRYFPDSKDPSGRSFVYSHYGEGDGGEPFAATSKVMQQRYPHYELSPASFEFDLDQALGSSDPWDFTSASAPIRVLDIGSKTPEGPLDEDFLFKMHGDSRPFIMYPDINAIVLGSDKWSHWNISKAMKNKEGGVTGRIYGSTAEFFEIGPEWVESRKKEILAALGPYGVKSVASGIWHEGDDVSEDAQLWSFGSTKRSMAVPLYHISPTQNRDRILQEGLRGNELNAVDSPWSQDLGQPAGNYFFNNPDHADQYVHTIHPNLFPDTHERPEGAMDYGVYNGYVTKEFDEPEPEEDGTIEDEDERYEDYNRRYEEWEERRQEHEDYPEEEPWDHNNPNHRAMLPGEYQGYDVWEVPEDALKDVRRDPESLLNRQRYEDVDWVPERDALKQFAQNPDEAFQDSDGPLRYYTTDAVPAESLKLHRHVPSWDLTEDNMYDAMDNTVSAPTPYHMSPIEDWQTYKPLPTAAEDIQRLLTAYESGEGIDDLVDAYIREIRDIPMDAPTSEKTSNSDWREVTLPSPGVIAPNEVENRSPFVIDRANNVIYHGARGLHHAEMDMPDESQGDPGAFNESGWIEYRGNEPVVVDGWDSSDVDMASAIMFLKRRYGIPLFSEDSMEENDSDMWNF